MQITKKGKRWEWRRSLWMLWFVPPFFFFNFIAFYYIGYRARQKKWTKAGHKYGIAFIIFLLCTELFPKGSIMEDIGFMIIFASWIISIVHAFKIRAEYLLRLEAQTAPEKQEKEMNELRQQIAQEYGRKGMHTDIKPEPNSKSQLNATSSLFPEQEQKHSEPPVQSKAQAKNRFDANSATEEELASIPGIGAILAKKVVMVRKNENGFANLQHFASSMRMKPHTVEKVKSYLIFDEKENKIIPEKPEGRIIDF